MNQKKIIAGEKQIGKRLDLIISSCFPEISRSFSQKLIKDKLVLVNQNIQKSSYIVKEKDQISLCLPDISTKIEAQNLKFDILYEDEEIIVINKSAGVIVHPVSFEDTNSLVNFLLYHYPKIKDVGEDILRPGIVHRLDKDTTGVILACKTNFSFQYFKALFKNRKIEKKYLAFVHGKIDNQGKIETPLGRHEKLRKIFSQNSPKTKEAITNFTLKKYFEKKDVSFIKVCLETGRTHQIRAHMKSIKHHIVGDPLYGKKKEKFKLKRQMLHSFSLSFIHPVSKEKMSICAKMPQDMIMLLKKL